jgi:hypothetical protein
MIRCRTLSKEWDIYFEGVGHYGPFPGFLQDLHNVGLQPRDMSPIFHTAEDFAHMWTKCLRTSSYLSTPQFVSSGRDSLGNITSSFTRANQNIVVDGNNDLANPAGWAPVSAPLVESNVVIETISTPINRCSNCV